jgi:hypothetical protein
MIERVVSLALRQGVRKGVVGGSGPWLVIAVAAGVVKFLRRPSRQSGGSAFLQLRPGDRYTVVCSEE